MADNVLAVWGSDHEAMRAAAREHALQFSWDSSMEALFGRVYPAAFERQRERQLRLAGEPALAA
jgi:alpha-1,6-mannosyltransferase